MKFSTLLVGVSLTINIVLLWELGGRLTGSTTPDPIVDPAGTRASRTLRPTEARAASEAWADLQAGDLRTQLDRLRAKGFPPDMVRAIMAAQVRAQFASRRKAIEASAPEAPFWDAARDPATEAALRALSREEQKTLRDLVGPDPENSMASLLRRTYPNLSAEKIEELADIRQRMMDKRSELTVGNTGLITATYQQKSAEIEKAAHAEMAAVLTPEEMEDYDLHESRTASQLRYSLEAFAATEAEYRAIYKLQSVFDEQFGNLGPGTSTDILRARTQARRDLDEQIKAALGPDRFADYQRATDYNYRQATQLVARLNLPPETANELYSLQKATQEQVINMRRTPATPAERNSQLAAIAHDAEATIAAKLGPSGLEAYKRYGGSWLNNIVPRPPPTPKR
jgi:hypothetical protein